MTDSDDEIRRLLASINSKLGAFGEWFILFVGIGTAMAIHQAIEKYTHSNMAGFIGGVGLGTIVALSLRARFRK